MHRKRVFEDFEIKHFGEYHDLYVKSDTHYFQLIFSKTLEKNAKFPSTHGLAWQAAFLKKQEKLLNDIDMLLMVEKGIRGIICNRIHWYEKATNNYMEDFDENKESSYLSHWDANNLYG